MGLLYELNEEHKKIHKMIDELMIYGDTFEKSDSKVALAKFKEMCDFWDEHEKKEENMFKSLRIKGIKFPFQKLDTQHKELIQHLKAIKLAFSSKNEQKIKETLRVYGKNFIEKLKKHMEYEEPVFSEMNFQLPFSE